MSTKLYIHATNIHQGGGKSLLWSIIEALPSSGSIVLVLDTRMPLPDNIPSNIQIKKVLPSILGRVGAERWLSKNVRSQDVVLCFGNLPPLLKSWGRTVVFVQNRYLIDGVKLNEFSLMIRLRLTIERLWLFHKLKNVDEFVVQTPAMKRLLEQKIGQHILVRVLPFMATMVGYSREILKPIILGKTDFDFVYVASGEPHKNHRKLLEAWCLLAGEGLFPSICLTLNDVRFATLCNEIEVMRQRYGLKVTNASELSHNDILALYKKSGALIYPSNFESFGLPLIEARQAGLPVLASELDYVRDVLDPEQTFDPESGVSIARAVKRFMGKSEKNLPLLDAAQFISHILEKVE
jgi:glycosyltransferase involved in cell wall biosynthesis